MSRRGTASDDEGGGTIRNSVIPLTSGVWIALQVRRLAAIVIVLDLSSRLREYTVLNNPLEGHDEKPMILIPALCDICH